MDRLSASRPHRRQNLLCHKIAFARSSRANPNSFVRHPDMQSVAVHIAVDRHTFDRHLAESAHYPNRNLPTIRYQYLTEHAP